MERSPNTYRPLLLLEQEIEERNERLNRYAQLPHAKASYLELETKSIATLTEVVQALRFLSRFSDWERAETAMKRLKRQDETIDSWMIQVDETANPQRLARIHLPFLPNRFVQ